MQQALEPYADIIRNGGVVAFPTETVYGLGASAWNAQAIQKIFELKGRPPDNPLIVHVCSWNQLLNFVQEVPDNSRILMQKFWPGPLTLIFRKKVQVLDLISGGLGTIAIRMPDNEIALKLISITGPLVAPSANISGRPSPTKAQHVREDFGTDIAVIDGGPTRIGLESTVLDLTSKPLNILRPGMVTAEMISEKCGILVTDVADTIAVNPDYKPISPGMKYTHYSPEAKIRWMEDGDLLKEGVFVIRHSEVTRNSTPDEVQYDGDVERMAKDIYDCFRQADINSYQEIWIEKLDSVNHPIVKALKNRIEKAIGRSEKA